jgi:hypothetical protein
MMIVVEERRSVSAEVTVEMIEAYLRRAGWGVFEQTTRYIRWALPAGDGPRAIVPMPRSGFHGFVWVMIEQAVRDISTYERRQPSAALSDIVGYQVGLDRGRASVLRNSASARVVEAREALARVKPHNAVEYERARVRLAQVEAELAAATRALEAANAADAQ